MQSKLHGVGAADWYGAILGATPSKGARSPALWNAVFQAFHLNAVFGAYDVAEPELGDVIAQLKMDPRFIGGAVAVPYKSAVLRFLDELEPECAAIGAVNAVYRKNGHLVGANTDGQGAVTSLLNFLNEPQWLRGRRILVIGAGGAGKAVAAYLAKGCGPQGRIRLANRTASRAEELMRGLRRYECALEIVGLDGLDAALAETDLLVNCTSVGSVDGAGTTAQRLFKVLCTPLARIPEPEEAGAALSWAAGACSGNIATSIERLAKLPQDAVVYDIVYRPGVTMLLKLADALGRRTFGGLGMNLEQAVIACRTALAASPLSQSGPSADAIREVMARVP